MLNAFIRCIKRIGNRDHMNSEPVNLGRKYWPPIGTARALRRYQFGDYRALLMDNIQASGRVQYLYVLEVYAPTGGRCLAVASEKNSFPDPDEPPSYFLGVFHGDCHDNFGRAEKWGDLDKFVERALEIVCEELQVEKAILL